MVSHFSAMCQNPMQTMQSNKIGLLNMHWEIFHQVRLLRL